MPVEIPVTTPDVAATVPTDVGAMLHAPPVDPSVNEAVALAHKSVEPPIAGGSVLIVMALSTLHPLEEV